MCHLTAWTGKLALFDSKETFQVLAEGSSGNAICAATALHVLLPLSSDVSSLVTRIQ
jgi:hypothetical protein